MISTGKFQALTVATIIAGFIAYNNVDIRFYKCHSDSPCIKFDSDQSWYDPSYGFYNPYDDSWQLHPGGKLYTLRQLMGVKT